MKKTAKILLAIILSLCFASANCITAFASEQGEILVTYDNGEVAVYKYEENGVQKERDGVYSFFYGMNNEIDSEVLRSALRMAGKAAEQNGKTCTVTVPEGIVYIYPDEDGQGNALMMYSNTVLNLTPQTRLVNTQTIPGNILMNGYSPFKARSSQAPTGYSGNENMVINGGIFDGNFSSDSCMIRMAHCKNVSFNNVTFINNKNSHHIEIAACDGVTFDGCVFEGQEETSTGGKEALQLDILEEKNCFSHFPAYDKTQIKNVTVTNCTFRNVCRGVGTHSAYAGLYFDNIKIINNTFENISQQAIKLINAQNSTVQGNLIKNCGMGILYYMADSANMYKAEKTVLADSGSYIGYNTIDVNTFEKNSERPYSYTTHPKGIEIAGHTYSSTLYSVNGVRVENNSITTQGSGILCDKTNNASITGNAILFDGSKTKAIDTPFYGISLDASSLSNISYNSVMGSFRHGVSLYSKSENNTVSGNIISNSAKMGICTVSSNGAVVSANNVFGVGDDGIYFSSSAFSYCKSNAVDSDGCYGINAVSGSGVEITENSISNSKKSGIKIEESYALLNNNSVYNSGGNGIYLCQNANVPQLYSNSISYSQLDGIYLSTGSYSEIWGNSVTNSGDNGIRTNSSASASKINSNTVNTTGDYGIYIQKSSVYNACYNKVSNTSKSAFVVGNAGYVVNMQSNKISSSASNGFYITGSSGVVNCKSNTVSSSKGDGILVNESSFVQNLTKNTFKSNSKNGIAVKGGGAVSARANTVKSNSQNGIYISSSNANNEIKSNTVQSNKKNGIYITKDAKALIFKNTVKSNKSNDYSLSGKKFNFTSLKKASVTSLSKSKTQITVKWKKVSNATGYIVYRSTEENGPYSIVKTVSKGSTLSFNDKSVKTKGTTYYYKVAAVKSVGKSKCAGSVSAVKSVKI